MKNFNVSNRLSVLRIRVLQFLLSMGIALASPFSHGTEIEASGGFCHGLIYEIAPIGFSGVCSGVRIDGPINDGKPLFNTTLGEGVVSASGTDSYNLYFDADTYRTYTVSGNAVARTEIGYNKAYAAGTATYDIDTGQDPYYAVSQASSMWFDTFYVHSQGSFSINMNWFVEGRLTSGPASYIDNAVMYYILNRESSQGDITTSDNVYLYKSDKYNYNEAFDVIGSGDFYYSGTYSITGNGDAAFVLSSNLWAAGNGTFTADILNTAGIQSLFVSDGVEITSASGKLKFDGEKYFYVESSVSAVPEPETYAMILGGLGLVGFTARRREIFLKKV